MTPNMQLTKQGNLFQDSEKYKMLVGKLNHFIVIHSYIAYSVKVVSQYIYSPIVNY